MEIISLKNQLIKMFMTEGITKEDLNSLLSGFENNVVEKIKKELIEKLPVRQFFTTEEFSALTGLEEQTIVNYCKSKSIKAFQSKIRGLWLIKASELDRLLKEAEDHLQANPKKAGKRNLVILNHPVRKRKAAFTKIYNKKNR